MKNRIAGRPHLAASVAAIAISLICFLVVLLLLASDQLRRMEKMQIAASTAIRAVDFDTRNVLLRLNRNYPPVCTEENLARLRSEVFLSTYQVDIGVLDGERRLLCSTVLGILPKPVGAPQPDVVFDAEQGMAYRVNFRIPLLVLEGRFPAMVISGGRFNTVVNPRETEEMFEQGDGTVRMLLPGGEVYLVRADLTLPPALISRLGRPEVLASTLHGFSWSDLAFVSSSRIAGTAYVNQYATPLARFFGDYRERLVQALLLALTLGILSYGALQPLFMGWSGLKHRIRDLLVERNVLCMYQPIVELRTGRPVGFEVLMRLRDGAHVLLPDEVFPAVVARDLFWQFDSTVLRSALRELGERLPGCNDLNVCFNFFPGNIRAERLRDLIEGELRRWGLAGLRIDIEVIEQADHGTLSSEIAGLKRAGYRISLDDFGTGYSNLASVRALAPDYLKIDKSFVYEMEDASLRSSLIPEMMGIARAVGAKVIAEGIENEAQREKLLAHGVEYGQGFLFARPMEIAALVVWLRGRAQAA